VQVHPSFESQEFARLLALARDGDGVALGDVLTAHRNFLLAVARQQLDSGVQAKLDESDVVQETLLDAGERFSQFRGQGQPELAAWLRTAVLHNLRDHERRYRGQRRAVAREVSADADSAVERQLIDEAPRPSARMRRREQDTLVDQALARLPKRYHDVIVLRHRDDLGFDEIARRLDSSENAVRKLWVRAVAKLRQELIGQ
jgi:RNA polymerase sigma-70 factor (ECF subfamily)